MAVRHGTKRGKSKAKRWRVATTKKHAKRKRAMRRLRRGSLAAVLRDKVVRHHDEEQQEHAQTCDMQPALPARRFMTADEFQQYRAIHGAVDEVIHLMEVVLRPYRLQYRQLIEAERKLLGAAFERLGLAGDATATINNHTGEITEHDATGARWQQTILDVVKDSLQPRSAARF